MPSINTALADKAQRFIETYNAEVDRWQRRSNRGANLDDFVLYDDHRIKWSRDLKLDLQRGQHAAVHEAKIRPCAVSPVLQAMAISSIAF